MNTIPVFPGVLPGLFVLLLGLIFIYVARFSYNQSFAHWFSNAGPLDWVLFITGLFEIGLGELMLLIVLAPYIIFL